MHIALTGATGLIGSAVLRHLVDRGDRVHALVRSEHAAATVSDAGATAVVVDFSDQDAIAAGFAQADAVVHLAASSDEPEAFDRRVAAAAVRTLGGTGRPYVHTGGVWVYGDGADLTEESPLDPPALTAWRTGVIEGLERSDLALTTIHPGIVYGDRGAGIPGLLAQQPRTEDGRLTTLGSGERHWTTIHVDDLASLYVAVVASGRGHGAVLGVSGANPTVLELSRAVAGDDGVATEEEAATRDRFGADFADALLLDQQADGAKARTIGGWTPTGPTLLEVLSGGR